jgi:YidC/Oxa1 family membrane protein insertase
MEGFRFVMAIVLSIAVVILVNILFPPTPPPERPVPDTVVVDTLDPLGPDLPLAQDSPLVPTAPGVGEPLVPTAPGVAEPGVTQPGMTQPGVTEPGVTEPGVAEPQVAVEDTVWVETDVARYGITTRGGSVASVELLAFESFTAPGPVQLVEPGMELVDFSLRVGNRVAPLDRIRFHSSLPAGDTTRVVDQTTLRLTGTLNGIEVVLEYGFVPDDYLVRFQGAVQGIGEADATLLLGLGPRLAVNEADSAEDLRALSYVAYSRRTGIESVRITNLDSDRIEEGPLAWAALRNKYFVATAMVPREGPAAFGGLIATGGPAGAEAVQVTLPLDRTASFGLRFYFGPQEYSRLAALGDRMEEVNPYGWRLFRPIIRPLAELVTWLLVAGRDVLGLGYGWVLILFGFAMRGLLWPLNAKAMRSQLKTMEMQPRIKEMQTKYKDKPEQLQKEMMRLYKEEGFNPLGGCIPMLIPWPVLITLFFVFQNTIEFRGVEFLWLPDLSRPDPLYILPFVLGASLWGLQYMNMRAAPQDNPQQKMLLWFMPILMVVIFLNFASGLNLYYAASNVASLPQQILIIRERKRARIRMDAKKKAEEEEARAAEAAQAPAKPKGGKPAARPKKGKKR